MFCCFAARCKAPFYLNNIADSVVFGDRFSIWGWATTPLQARARVVLHILDRARECGVLQDAWDSRKLRKRLLQPDLTGEWLTRYLEWSEDTDRVELEGEAEDLTSDIQDDDMYMPPPIVPSVFHNVTWKSDESFSDGKGLRYRDNCVLQRTPFAIL